MNERTRIAILIGMYAAMLASMTAEILWIKYRSDMLLESAMVLAMFAMFAGVVFFICSIKKQ